MSTLISDFGESILYWEYTEVLIKKDNTKSKSMLHKFLNYLKILKSNFTEKTLEYKAAL